MYYRPENLLTLKHLLRTAERGGYAIGAFSPRYTPSIRAIFRAGQKLQSPLIVQIAQIELEWYNLTLREFAFDFWEQFDAERPAIPFGLHLDHTQDFDLIREAISYGFTSVMIDASPHSLLDNIAITQEVVDYAHARGVSVEAELGRIGAADASESESSSDEELFTDPEEAEVFVRETGVDALAVSVGTAHGVYTVRTPRIDLERLKVIRARTPVHLVLHGGSGTPADLIGQAIHLPGGGISKINIATDLELGLLRALGRQERMTNADAKALAAGKLEVGLAAVQAIAEDKIANFLGSHHRASDFIR
ncbi:MAG: class II fructose-bisphosphate aldolase [Anaerolineae bacterium]|nr:class II fructose-bisphosphate aldolase [Anaerolineae bacterium]